VEEGRARCRVRVAGFALPPKPRACAVGLCGLVRKGTLNMDALLHVTAAHARPPLEGGGDAPGVHLEATCPVVGVGDEGGEHETCWTQEVRAGSAAFLAAVSGTCQAAGRTVVANYYQTLDGDVAGQRYTHWFAAALHFGTNADGSPYIHWNDWDPGDARFGQAWADLKQLKDSGAAVLFMVGGAGGAFQALFRDFGTYYALLRDFLTTHPVVDGLDLDVEEDVELDDVRMLIRQLDADFGPRFVITMAPLAASLASDVPGLGGFVYKDLWRTEEGARVDWFNGQFYGGAWSVATLQAIVANGYPADKIVMGMLFADFPDPADAHAGLAVLAQCRQACPHLRGACVWEHALAPLGPREWAAQVAATLAPTANSRSLIRCEGPGAARARARAHAAGQARGTYCVLM
jgi:hypothetical protein